MRPFVLVAAALTSMLYSSPAVAQHHTLRFLTNFGGIKKLHAVEFSPQSNLLAVAVDQTPLTIIDTATGNAAHELKTVSAHTLRFAESGKRLLTVGSRDTLLVNTVSGETNNVSWDVPPGYTGLRLEQRLGKLMIDEVLAGSPAAASGKLQAGDELTAVVVRGKEKSLLGSAVDDAVRLLAGPAGTPVQLRVIPKGGAKPIDLELRREAAVMEDNRLVFRPRKAGVSPQVCLVYTNDGLVLLDANSGNVVSVLQPVEIERNGPLAISPDGRLLVLVANRTVRPRKGSPFALELYDVAAQQRKEIVSLDMGTVSNVRFSADGRRILIGEPDLISVYDIERKAFVAPILVGFDPKGEEANKKESAPLLDVRPDIGTGRFLSESRRHASETLLTSFDLSADGKFVAVGTKHGQCRLWSTERHACLATIGEPSAKSAAAAATRLSPDGRWVAYFVEGTLHVVNIEAELKKAVVEAPVPKTPAAEAPPATP